MASIKDVAKRAGVSISTVSNVINGTKFVSDETKHIVQIAIKELGYEVDTVARSMKSNQTNKIGIVVDDICGLFYPYIIKAISGVAEKAGYNIIICDTGSEIKKEKKSIRELVAARVDGIILSSSISTEFIEDYAYELKNLMMTSKKKVGLVSIDRDFSEYGIDSVFTNMEEGGRKATQHLIDIGCKEIGHITGPIVASVVQDRIRGYKKAMQDCGKLVSNSLIAHGDYSHLSGYLGIKNLLDRNPNMDGVFIGNDQMAIGACKAIKELGLSIPKNIKIVGFDDVFVSSIVEPSLSTIHIKKKHLGLEAIHTLLDQIENGPDHIVKRIELENYLVIRNTTDENSQADWVLTDW